MDFSMDDIVHALVSSTVGFVLGYYLMGLEVSEAIQVGGICGVSSLAGKQLWIQLCRTESSLDLSQQQQQQ
jgi:hypothetical protein